MKHATHRLAWFMTFVVWFMFINLLIIILFWLIPRDIANLEMTSTQSEYVAGDTVEIELKAEIYGTADSTYTSKIICRNGAERVWHIRTIVVSSSPSGGVRDSFASYPIPEGAYGHACVVEVVSTHKVEILPLVHKTIYDKWESNTFEIKE